MIEYFEEQIVKRKICNTFNISSDSLVTVQNQDLYFEYKNF